MLVGKNNSIIFKIILSILIFWGFASFFLFVAPDTIKIVAGVFTLLSLFLLFAGIGQITVMNFILFTNLYASYGLLFTYGLPLSVVIIAILAIFAFCFLFLVKENISSENFSLHLIFFLLLISEMYLALSFWLVNPLTRSFFILAVTHLYFGFLRSVKGEQFDFKNFRTYIYTSVLIVILMVLTLTWGQ